MARAGLTFCCIQEVKYRNSGKKLIRLDSGEEFEFHWCGRQKRREAGVGFLIKVDPRIMISDPDTQDARYMSMDLKIYGFNLRVINVYSPTESNGSDNQKDLFYRSINKVCKKREKHQKVIVVGDFNAKTSLAYKKCNYDGISIIPDDDSNDNGSRLKSFCMKNRFSIASTFFDYSMEERYTWYSCDKTTRKVNDYVLSESFVQQYITNCIVKPEFDFDSDHRILITFLYTPMTRKARWMPKTHRKNPPPNIKALQVKEIHERFNKYVSENILISNRRLDSPSDMSNRIIKTLETAALVTIPPTTKKKEQIEIWKEDHHLNSLINERQGETQGSEKYKELTKKIKSVVKTIKNEKLRKEANEINEHANRRRTEDMFRGIKSGTTSFRNIKRGKQCDTSKLKEYFIIHFNQSTTKDDPIEIKEAPAFIELLKNIPENILSTAPPDRNELTTIIKSLKNGKTANDIPTAYIKHAIDCSEFMDEMVKLYKTVWETNTIPTKWGHSKLVTIWKGSSKGNINDPKAYRGLQIGSSLCKIMIVIIINRLKKWYEKQLLDQQQGFRSCRGTTDGIYIVKKLHQITDQMKKPAFLLFVDLSAAFDHINRDWLFKTLKQRLAANTSSKLVQLLESLYSHTTTALAETPEDMFEITLGVRQGGPESPLLYNLYMDFVMRVFADKCKAENIEFLELVYKIPESATINGRTKSGNVKLDWCGYADDLALAFNDRKSLQTAMDTLNTTFCRYNLKINVSKTKTMILNQQYINVKYPSTISSLNTLYVENVKVFRYLGCQIKFDEPGTGESETELRIDCAECKFYELGRQFMNHNIAIETRVRVLNSLVRSRLAYSCQAWSMTQRQMARVRSTYMSMLRKMVSGGYRRKPNSWSYVLTNETLLRNCKTESVESYVKRQQRNFVAHMVRKEDSSMVKRLLFNNNEIRKPGPRTSLYLTVIANEKCTGELFNRGARSRIF